MWRIGLSHSLAARVKINDNWVGPHLALQVEVEGGQVVGMAWQLM